MNKVQEKEKNCITKKLFTDSDFIETGFDGNEVVSSTITPKGVAKARIDLRNGIVTIEKRDSDFTGEVTLEFETTDGNDSYKNNYTIAFKESEAEKIEEDDVVELDDEDEVEEIYDDSDDGVELLSDEEEEDTSGAGTITRRTKTIYIKSCFEKIGKSVIVRSRLVVLESSFKGNHSWKCVSSGGSYQTTRYGKKMEVDFRDPAPGKSWLFRCTTKNNGTTYYESWKIIVKKS